MNAGFFAALGAESYSRLHFRNSAPSEMHRRKIDRGHNLPEHRGGSIPGQMVLAPFATSFLQRVIPQMVILQIVILAEMAPLEVVLPFASHHKTSC